MKRFIILGAGISGLSLAWFLKQRFSNNVSIAILEKDECPGGWVKTTKQDGFLFEEGPRSCRSKGAGGETLRLIEQLGLQDQVILAGRAARYRYLWMDKKLCQLPTGLLSLFTSPFLKDIVTALVRDLTAGPSQQEDESIYNFVARRFNSNIAEKLLDPLTKGIYAGDIHQLSIKSCFPILHQWEQAHGSVLKGAFKKKKKNSGPFSPFVQEFQKSSLFSLKSGMEALIRELAGRLEDNLLLSSEVASCRFLPKGVEVDLVDGTTLEADHVFSTIPACGLSPLFAPIHQELSELLVSVPSVSTTVVNLGYHKTVLEKQGFGYLVPSKEKEDILGVVWNSSIFPQQNRNPEETRLTVMMGSAHMPNFDTLHEQEFATIALEALSRHLNIDTQPDTISVKIAKSAIPQYLVGHAEKVAAMERTISMAFPCLTLSGNSFYGVSVNDCIVRSKQIVESANL
ncbi:MAG: protoporphyrinogen oxidase [Waddliaceae bacterium]